MPLYNKPLPSIRDEDRAPEAPSATLASGLDLLDAIQDAKDSPSPLARILQDPTLVNPTSSGESKKRHKGREHREHRTPIVAAMAIAEMERKTSRMKTLLQATGDRLEHEMRRAEEATAQADYAERQAHTLLARARAAELAQQQMKDEMLRMERETRDLQIQLEGSQRETRRLRDGMEDVRQEMEQLQRSERKAHEAANRNDATVQEYHRQAAGVQKIIDQWYESGQQEGYDEGYDRGYEDGRRAGIKRGKKEGFREGIEIGRSEERHNAIQAIDKFLDTDDKSKTGRICRWAESVYMKEDRYAETVGPGDSVSVV